MTPPDSPAITASGSLIIVSNTASMTPVLSFDSDKAPYLDVYSTGTVKLPIDHTNVAVGNNLSFNAQGSNGHYRVSAYDLYGINIA